MLLRLYSERPPAYRALLFISELGKVSTLPSQECIAIGERLFDTQFSRESPVLVPLKAPADLTTLTQMYYQAGIVVERVEAD